MFYGFHHHVLVHFSCWYHRRLCHGRASATSCCGVCVLALLPEPRSSRGLWVYGNTKRWAWGLNLPSHCKLCSGSSSGSCFCPSVWPRLRSEDRLVPGVGQAVGFQPGKALLGLDLSSLS